MFAEKCFLLALIISVAGLVSAHPLSSSYSKNCLRSNGKFPKEGSLCRSYYECKKWSAREKKCSGKEHFHPAKERCVHPDEYPCFEKPPKSSKCPRENGKFLVSGTHCRKFYECCDGRPTKRKCPGDLLFDPDREACEYPELYQCVEDRNKISTSSELPKTGQDKTTTEVTTTSVWTSSPPTPISTTDGEISTNEQSTTSPTSTFEESSLPDAVITTEDTFETAATSVTSISTTSTPISSETISDLSTRHQTSTGYDSTETSLSSVATTGQNDKTEIDITEKSSTTSISLPSTSLQTSTVTETIYENSTNEPSSTAHDQTAWPTGVPRSSALPTTRKDREGKDTFDLSSLSPGSIPSTTSGQPLISTEIVNEHSTSYLTTDEETTRSSNWISQTPESRIGSSENEVDGSSLSTSAISETDAASTLSESSTDIDPNVFTTISSTGISTLTSQQPTVKEVTRPVTDDFHCPEPDGHFPHPTNRHKFIACVAGNLYVMDCAADLVFNYEKMECDYDVQ